MHTLSATRQKIELVEVQTKVESDDGRLVVRATGVEERSGRIARAAMAFLGMRASEQLQNEPPLGVFREKDSGLLRVVHKEILLRWAPRVSTADQHKLLDKYKLEIVDKSKYVKGQMSVKRKNEDKTGAELVELSNQMMDHEEFAFASPNFISEFKRSLVVPAIHKEQWHLKNLGALAGQVKDEDVKAAGAWAITQGKKEVIIAVLDDGVDLEHPNLKANIHRIPDPDDARDVGGRDFFVPDSSVEHFNPRPKVFQFPFDQMAGNDIHGTPCAGVIAANGKVDGVRGIAPKCRILAVKVFHGDNLAQDSRVAEAIRYASRRASILSCSWSGPNSTPIELAVQDTATDRGGKGTMMFCAAGNENASPVRTPARFPNAIAISASTDQAKIAGYSNIGPEIWVSAPSSGGTQGIFTTDVSIANRGFNLGTAGAGGTDGLHTNDFGGTSSATPLVAGVAALVLSVKPDLTCDQVKQILKDTADKIDATGGGYDASGRSKKYGFGRVNAEKAVAAAKAM